MGISPEVQTTSSSAQLILSCGAACIYGQLTTYIVEGSLPEAVGFSVAHAREKKIIAHGPKTKVEID